MKYKIEIQSLGFETTSKIVDRPSLNRVTKNDILEAKVEWCDHNAIDTDDNFEMPFTRITKV
jgi:serine/threonine protein kinase HipA of HipAB toxin-antitoxin module